MPSQKERVSFRLESLTWKRYKDGVQKADARKIPHRSEMRHSLPLRRIMDIHRYIAHFGSGPCGIHNRFQFEFIQRSIIPPRIVCPAERIHSESALRIIKADTCLHPVPEIGKPVGKSVSPGHILASEISAPDIKRVRPGK